MTDKLHGSVVCATGNFWCTWTNSGLCPYGLTSASGKRSIPARLARPLNGWRTVIVSLLMVVCASARADLIVTYVQTDLPDLVTGSDLRRYDYELTGYAFNAGDSLSVYFDYGLYRDIQALSGPPGWLIDAAEPDQLLGPGIFVSQSPAADDSPRLVFGVSFVWIGSGTPAEQTYEILGPEPDFDSIAGGVTEAVPEPSAVALLLAGLALIAIARRKRGR